MSKTRQDSTILLQAGLNGLNQALTAAEIKYFVPIYDDLIDPNVRTNPLETSACVSSATRGLNTLTPNDIRGAYFFKQTTAATQNWSVDISATSGWSYYSDTTGGYTSIQGELTCWKSGSSVSAASCYGGTKAVSGASISGGVITGSTATQCPAETGWVTSKLYDSVVYVGQRSTDDSAAAQYAVNLNSSVVGSIIFNKLLVFSKCAGGSYQPLACIALAEPIAIKNDGTGLSDITIEFSVNFTANLSNVPVNVIADTSGYWYYTSKTEGIDGTKPLFTPGRVKIWADPFGVETSAFVTMGGVGTSGLRFIDIFASEEGKSFCFRNTKGGMFNVGDYDAIDDDIEECRGSVIAMGWDTNFSAPVKLPSNPNSSLLIGHNNSIGFSANRITVIGNNNIIGSSVTRSYIFGDDNKYDITSTYSFNTTKVWPTFIFGSTMNISATSAIAQQFGNTVGGNHSVPSDFNNNNFRYEYNFIIKTPDYSTSNRAVKIGACAIQSTTSTDGETKTLDNWRTLMNVNYLPTYRDVGHSSYIRNGLPTGSFIIQEIPSSATASDLVDLLKGKNIICSYTRP